MDNLYLFPPDDNTPKKTCTGPCGRTLPATTEYFYPKKRGMEARCKACRNAQARERYKSPDVRKRKRDHCKEYQSHSDVKQRRQARSKEYQSRPEIQQRRYELQRTRLAKPEARERTNMHRREYRKKPEIRVRKTAEKRNRDAHKRTVSGTHTSAQIQSQLQRQKHKCYYCQKRLQKQKGKYVYHAEHTFPISRVAGTDIPANSIDYIVLACPACNLSKGDKFPWEWIDGGRLL